LPDAASGELSNNFAQAGVRIGDAEYSMSLTASKAGERNAIMEVRNINCSRIGGKRYSSSPMDRGACSASLHMTCKKNRGSTQRKRDRHFRTSKKRR